MIKPYSNNGFTLVEMLVVIVILGILTSLSVFGYQSWQQGLAERQVQSDLQIAASAMENAKNFGAGYPSSLPSNFTSSDRVTLTYRTGSLTSYCIDAVHTSTPSVQYFINSAQGSKPQVGTCPPPPVLGETWTALAAPAANSWMAVAYGAGKFVAVSSTGTSRVMTSTDGTTWTLQSSAVAAAGNWTNVQYDNGKFIALGNSTGTNRVMTSPDGITWTAGTLAAYNWEGTAYGANKHVALNANTPTTAYTSTDGLTWSTTAGIPSGNWSDIAYGNQRFVAGAISGTNRMMYSSNGTTWTVSTLTNGSFSGINDVIYAGGKFVASANSSSNNMLTSSDGVTWTGVTVPELGVGASLISLEHTGSLYVGVGNNRIMTSTDGISWTNRTSPEANPWRSVAYGNGKLVAVATSGTNRIMVSP